MKKYPVYSKKVKKMVYGGDYNPEQWPEEIWEEDMKLFKEAHIDIVTLNVFSWAYLQPSEEEYRFDKLDKIMELVTKNGMQVCLATSTAAHPAWMAKRYPDILRTDFEGRKRKFGGRHNSCPNSLTYQKYSVRLAKKLAERYKDYDNIIAWHISNEYGGECYCENCEKQFRVWLREKYHTIDELNRAWNTSFWGHTFYDWDEIVVPNALTEQFSYDRTMFQGISIDYRRFNSDSILKCFKMERDAVKQITPDIPVTTNLMSFHKPLDYKKWGQEMDFVSWDNYPSVDDSVARTAMNHDLMRGVGNQKPFLLMEQTPSVTNWQSYNALKRPGVMRLWSYQAVAHGADSVMFFQMRRSIGACEKLHGAVIDHVGNGNTRVFREITALGAELEKLGDLTLGSRMDSKVALYFDWENWWGIEFSAGPSVELKYLDEMLNYYQALHAMNIPVDIVGPQDELDSYHILIAPVLYMTQPGYDEKIRRFVKAGGSFITTFFSGIVDEHDLVVTGGYPGKLRDILGIWVEESDALPNGTESKISYQGREYPARVLCDLMHLEGAKSLGEYEEDFYAHTPAITENDFGSGKAYYVGTRSNDKFYHEFLEKICKDNGVTPILAPQEELEVTRRVNDKGTFIFVLNHGTAELTIQVEEDSRLLLSGSSKKAKESFALPAKGVEILQID